MKETREQALVFREAILAVCHTFGFAIKHYHIEYDEYDSDDGMEIVPLINPSDLIDLERMKLAK